MTAPDIACPHCQQVDAVQRVESICGSETSTTKTTGTQSSWSSGHHGSPSFSTYGVSSATSQHSTTLATELAAIPKEKTSYATGVAILFALPALLTLFAIFNAPDDPSGAFVIICFWSIFYTFTVSRIRTVRQYNRTIRAGKPVVMSLWTQLWFCRRCGGCYWPAPTQPSTPTRQMVTTAQARNIMWTYGGYPTSPGTVAPMVATPPPLSREF